MVIAKGSGCPLDFEDSVWPDAEAVADEREDERLAKFFDLTIDVGVGSGEAEAEDV